MTDSVPRATVLPAIPDESRATLPPVEETAGSVAHVTPSAPAKPHSPDANGASAPATPDVDPELDTILRFTRLEAKDLERASRIRARLEVKKPLGDVLVDLKLLSEEELARARRRRSGQMSLADILQEEEHLSDEGRAEYDAEKAKYPSPTDREVLVGGSLVREEQYLRAIGLRLDIPFAEPRIGEIDTDLYKLLPFAYLLKNLVLPIAEEDGLLKLIVATPEDEEFIGEVERRFGMHAKRYCSTKVKITEALRTLERLRGKPADQEQFKVHYHVLDRAAAAGDEGGKEAIQLVDYLLTRAIQLKASDLHIEPGVNRIRVRTRIDGVLHQLTDLPIDFGPRVTARVKILARLDVTEKRHHQDGKIHVRVGGRDADIRVSTYVSTFGETIVMRLLDREKGILPVDEMGFQPKAFGKLTEVVLKASSGLVLVVGPTGSGKTTTLYSFVEYANSPNKKVITCEDPVEYVVDGIIQCSVNAKTGPTFADSLRAIVRQDPDTIVVGEIRDQITAELAVEAALTGHKVYSTFHTEEAVGAFVRLLEMGVEPFLVGSTVSAVIAQRLVRGLCPNCKARVRPTRNELRFLQLDREEVGDRRFMGPRECEECGGTGYRGRLAVHEVLVPSDEFRNAVMDRAPTDELRRIARTESGFLTMMEDGVLKAAQGLTSLDEIIEHAPRDSDARSLSDIERASITRRG